MKLLNKIILMSLLSSALINVYTKDCYELQFLKACENGNKKKILKEISRGININCTNTDKRTGLILGTINGKLNVCKILLKNGALLDLKDIYSWDAPMYATHRDHTHIQELFEKAKKE